ncbi:pyrroloquinoline quinone biosynthesis peptide chaperone PqqD [Actinomadura fulvescens]
MVLRRDRTRGADILLMPERVVVLNETAARILRLCDGEHSVDDIVTELGQAFPGAPVNAEVPTFLRQVMEAGWLR